MSRICILSKLIFAAVTLLSISLTPFAHAAPGDKKISLASGGKTKYVILLDSNASPAEKYAAKELSAFLKKVSSADFNIVSQADLNTQPVIAVGPDAAQKIFPNLDLTGLGPDGIIIRSSSTNIILTGGKAEPRGTLYAVYTFLEDMVGCHWWTAEASTIPHCPDLTIPAPDIHYIPAFEYREPYITEAFDEDWAVRNKTNGGKAAISEQKGGQIRYARFDDKNSFCHTFNLIVNKKYAKEHPEWLSEINGKRILPPQCTQLCLTNKELLKFCIERVRKCLRKSPRDAIISISQNDWNYRCQCKNCRDVEVKEKSPSGLILRFVNAISDAIKDEFPKVKVDTIAYKYSRKPPVISTPRPNVIVRLCSIECSFSQPMTAPVNRKFADDIRDWSNICKRLYIWDYVTNFSHYMLPYPNLRVLGPNLRFFAKNGARGVFALGSYRSKGSEFGCLRAWVLAKLLWNPQLDDKKLIRKFTEGYYGKAAPFILKYINILHDEVEKENYPIRYVMVPSAPFLNCALLEKAEKLFAKAEQAVAGSEILLKRVRLAHAPVIYAIIKNYPGLYKQCSASGKRFPFKPYNYYLRNFISICEANNIFELAEGKGSSLKNFKQLNQPMKYRTRTAVPEICPAGSKWFDIQDSNFRLHHEGQWVERRKDRLASDAAAARMPTTHTTWAIQIPLPYVDDALWDVYIAARVVIRGKGSGTAFQCGIYDTSNKKTFVKPVFKIAATSANEYKLFKITTTKLDPAYYIWIAPTKNSANVAGIWIDRIIFVRTGNSAGSQ